MNDLLEKVMSTRHKFNEYTMGGVGRSQLSRGPKFIDEIIEEGMPKCSDFTYNGYRILGPEEEFKSLIANNNSKIEFDVTRSDLYKVNLSFTYQGQNITKQIYMPFARKDGTTVFSDVKYMLNGILTDTVISPSSKNVFIRLIRDKLNYLQLNYNIKKDNEEISGQVIYSGIYRIKKHITNKLGRVQAPSGIYVLAKYGLVETFKKYLNIEDLIISTKKIEDDKYCVYCSAQLDMKFLKIPVEKNPIYIAIPKDKVSTLSSGLITSLIYLTDIFSKNTKELVEVINSGNVELEKSFYKIMLGNIIFKGNHNVERVIDNMNDHFDSLEHYIPSIIKRKLREVGVVIDNFFDLNMLILDKFSEWLVNSKEMSNNFHNRYLDVVYYILYDVMTGINTALDEISRKINNRSTGMPSFLEVSKIINEKITPKRIFSIIKTNGVNLSLNMLDIAGDNLVHKGTSILSLQEFGDGVQKGKKSGLPPHLRVLSAMNLVVGSVYGMKKKTPSSFATLNPYLKIDEQTGRMHIDKELLFRMRITDLILKYDIDEDREEEILLMNETSVIEEKIKLD